MQSVLRQVCRKIFKVVGHFAFKCRHLRSKKYEPFKFSIPRNRVNNLQITIYWLYLWPFHLTQIMAFQTWQIAWYCVIDIKLKILYYTQSTAGRCTTFSDSKWNEYNNSAIGSGKAIRHRLNDHKLQPYCCMCTQRKSIKF